MEVEVVAPARTVFFYVLLELNLASMRKYGEKDGSKK